MRITAFWITGRSGSGKTTLAEKIAAQVEGVVIDGEKVRKDFNDDDFSPAGSRHHIERMVRIALNHENMGIIPVIAVVSREKRFRKTMQSRFKNCVEIKLKGGTMWEGLEYED